MKRTVIAVNVRQEEMTGWGWQYIPGTEHCLQDEVKANQLEEFELSAKFLSDAIYKDFIKNKKVEV